MRRGSAMAATAVGAGVGLLGGLIGLGGAEFRLPLLVGLFAIRLRRAIGLNLGVSFFTVLAALTVRLGGSVDVLPEPAHIMVALVGGGVAGAYLGASWLIGASSAPLLRGVRGLLGLIGVLLLVEAFVPWRPVGLVEAPLAQAFTGLLAGILIGAVSSLLGVAGGELIIPTLVFAFGVDIKAAGSASLVISVPTIMMGLWRQRASGLRLTSDELTDLVLPMSAGSVVGAVAGAMLVAFVPGASLKGVLGLVLVGSAVRLGAHAPEIG